MNLEEFENMEMDDGWVEWPSFPENENKFDWSLSYDQMEKRYNPAKKKKIKSFNYNLSTSFPRPKEKDIIKPAPPVKKEVKPAIDLNTQKALDEKVEYQIFIQNQTAEQFRLSQKHGWRIAKMLTEPEPNFHEQAN